VYLVRKGKQGMLMECLLYSKYLKRIILTGQRRYLKVVITDKYYKGMNAKLLMRLSDCLFDIYSYIVYMNGSRGPILSA